MSNLKAVEALAQKQHREYKELQELRAFKRRVSSAGDAVIAAIIAGELCSARCAEDPDHPCIIVWSSGAAEQLEAAISKL